MDARSSGTEPVPSRGAEAERTRELVGVGREALLYFHLDRHGMLSHAHVHAYTHT